METKQKNLKLFAIIQNYCESFFNFVSILTIIMIIHIKLNFLFSK